jgi:hypothetical protein
LATALSFHIFSNSLFIHSSSSHSMVQL